MSDDKKSPLSVEEQESPEPERLETPQEEAGMAIQQLDDPPQAEGSRDDVQESEEEGAAGEE